MEIAAIIFILSANYYTFTYGKSLWKDDQNKLAAIGAVLIAALSVIVSISVIVAHSP